MREVKLKPKKKGAAFKQHLQYISISIMDNMSRKLLRSRFGLVGIGFYDELRVRMGANTDGGYFIPYEKKRLFLLADELRIDESAITGMLEFMFEEDILSKEKANKFGILTCEEAQQNWVVCAKERKLFQEGIVEDYMLIDVQDAVLYNAKKFGISTENEESEVDTIEQNFDAKILNVPVNSINVPHNSINDTFNSIKTTKNEVKEKKRNINKIKEEKGKEKKRKFLLTTVNIKNAFTGLVLEKSVKLQNFSFKKYFENNANLSDSESTKGKEKKVAAKKEKHPCRDKLVYIYEKQGATYANNKEENFAINSLIRYLEKECRRNFTYDDAAPEKLHDDIVQYYQDIINQRDKLSPFLQKSLHSFGFTLKKITAIILELKNANRKELEGKGVQPISRVEALNQQNINLYNRIIAKHQNAGTQPQF